PSACEVTMDCFASLAMTWRASPNTTLSSPAKAGDPVRRGLSIQSSTSLEYWVARSSRAMTTECRFAFSRLKESELCQILVSQREEGAGNAGCLLHPRSRVQN